jgi:hypothetical protein
LDTVPYTSGVNFARTQTLFSIGAEWNGALQYIGSVDRLKVSVNARPDQLDFQAVPPAVGPSILNSTRAPAPK